MQKTYSQSRPSDSVFKIAVGRTSFTIINQDTGVQYSVNCPYKTASELFLAVTDQQLFNLQKSTDGTTSHKAD